MIKELEEGLVEQLEKDKEAYDQLCKDCDRDIGQYKHDIDRATHKQKSDKLLLDQVVRVRDPLIASQKELERTIKNMVATLPEIKKSYETEKHKLNGLKSEALDALNALLEAKRMIKAGLWDNKPAGSSPPRPKPKPQMAWFNCATEGGMCQCPSGHKVRYGKGTKWAKTRRTSG